MMPAKKIIRENFRREVFLRDGYRCVMCGAVESLDVHHITDRNEMPNGGYVKENGITVCPIHHQLSEMWHKSLKQEYWNGFHPDDLYKKIKSSYQLAVSKSLELK